MRCAAETCQFSFPAMPNEAVEKPLEGSRKRICGAHLTPLAMLGVMVRIKPTLVALALVLAWVSGMFFGMGLEWKLLERKNCKIKASNGNDGAYNPLPMPKIETPDSTDQASDTVPAVVASVDVVYGGAR